MIEDIISKLDTRGLMVLSILISKRYMDILKDTELKDKDITNGTKVTLDVLKDTVSNHKILL